MTTDPMVSHPDGSEGSTGQPVLEARGLAKSYRRGPEEVHALVDVSFRLDVGEVVALVGPSGSGKTTLLNVVCGWEHPDGGQLEWSGDVGSQPAERPWRELAIVPQDLGLLEELSVWENAELPLRLGGLRGQPWTDKVSTLLASLGLEEYVDRRPEEMSLGEQQRLALARAMVMSPRLLLADEPTGHQDADWARTVFTALRSAAQQGTTSLVATHSSEFLKYVDRVMSMRDGRLRETDREGRLSVPATE